MISAIAAAQGISKSQADVLAGDWKSKFMSAVEPLGSTGIYEDGRYVNVVDKLNNIANDRATAQRFVGRILLVGRVNSAYSTFSTFSS